MIRNSIVHYEFEIQRHNFEFWDQLYNKVALNEEVTIGIPFSFVDFDFSAQNVGSKGLKIILKPSKYRDDTKLKIFFFEFRITEYQSTFLSLNQF